MNVPTIARRCVECKCEFDIWIRSFANPEFPGAFGFEVRMCPSCAQGLPFIIDKDQFSPVPVEMKAEDIQ
jgi:hypothetical protein